MIIPTGKKKNVNIRHTGPWWRLGSGVWGWSRYGWHVLGSGPRGAAALGWYNQQVTLYDICSLGTLRTQPRYPRTEHRNNGTGRDELLTADATRASDTSTHVKASPAANSLNATARAGCMLHDHPSEAEEEEVVDREF